MSAAFEDSSEDILANTEDVTMCAMNMIQGYVLGTQ